MKPVSGLSIYGLRSLYPVTPLVISLVVHVCYPEILRKCLVSWMMPLHCPGSWFRQEVYFWSTIHLTGFHLDPMDHVQAVVAFWSSTRTCRLAATRTSRSCSTCWRRSSRQLLKPRSHRRRRPANGCYRLRGPDVPRRRSLQRSRSWQAVCYYRGVRPLPFFRQKERKIAATTIRGKAWEIQRGSQTSCFVVCT